MAVKNKLVCVLLLVLAVISPAAAQDKVVAVAGPRIAVDQPTYDFGAVSQGEVVQHSFNIRNNGSSVLEIKRVQSDCGCTTSIPEPRTIAPGASGVIQTSFDTAGFVGEKVKAVRVFSNDPQRPSLVLSLKGSVNTEVEADPVRVFFGKVRKGSDESKTVTVSASPGADVKILDVSSRSEQIDIKVKDDSQQKSKTFAVSLKPTTSVGVLRTRIVVKTSSKRTPVINIPVFARVEGDMRFEPSEMSFGLIPGPAGNDVVKTVRLINESKSGQKVHVLKAETSDPDLKVEVSPIKDGLEYQLKVSVAEGSVGTVTGRVDITTDHPDPEQQKLSLPVYGIIANKGA